MLVKIDYKKCIGCKRCYDLCPMDVFSWDEEKDMPVVAYEEVCWLCGTCFMECPKRAVDITLPVSMW